MEPIPDSQRANLPEWQRKTLLAQRNGQRNTIYGTDGSAYKGEWKDAMRHGLGIHVFSNGDVYK
ncbi:hypothetical protein KIPB_015466, partial [Kipferlia bialata]|eukprot:g15466.t1